MPLNPELALIQNLLLHPYLYERCKDYIGRITPEDFEDEAAAQTISMIKDAFSHEPLQTPQSLFSLLTAESTPDNVRSFTKFILSNSECIGVTSEIDMATQSISDSARRRALKSSAVKILASVKDSSATDVTEIIQNAQRDIAAIAAQLQQGDAKHNKPQDAVDLSLEFLKGIQDGMDKGGQRGLMTGFESIDEITTGLKPGSLNILAARPGVGKTAFALNIIENVAIANSASQVKKPVVLFSLEMPKHQIIKRMFSTFGKVAPKNLEDGELTKRQWDDIFKNIKAMCINTSPKSACNLYIDDNVSLTASGIVETVREIAKDYDGISLIAVDYVQLLKPEYRGQNRNTELAETSRTLKLLAMEFQCPVLALSQLNRDIDRRANHKPVNSDLRDSGALEADADTIMFLSKDSQGSEEHSSPTGVDQILVSISKNRHGGIGEVTMSFTGMFSMFEDNKTKHAKRMAEIAEQRNPANFRKQKISAT